MRLHSILMGNAGSLLLVLGLVGSSQPSHAGAALPCTMPPAEAAIEFFSQLEARGLSGSGGAVWEMFSRRFLDHSSAAATQKFIEDAQRRYRIDAKDRPFRERLVSYPRVDTDKGGSSGRSVQVSLLTLSATGKVEQSVAMICEEGFWKVVNLSYGPGGYR